MGFALQPSVEAEVVGAVLIIRTKCVLLHRVVWCSPCCSMRWITLVCCVSQLVGVVWLPWGRLLLAQAEGTLPSSRACSGASCTELGNSQQ